MYKRRSILKISQSGNLGLGSKFMLALMLLIGVVMDGLSQIISKKKPNIILINVDDLGWKDIGCMGSSFYETPEIDKLARMGMVFSNGYAASANSAPSRACLMTGLRTPRHGIYTVANSDRGKPVDRMIIPTKNTDTLADSFVCFPTILQQNGYRTCIAGKWHLSNDPTKSGFAVNYGGSHAGNPASYYPPYKNIDIDAKDKEYLTDVLTRKAIDFMGESTSQPFFLYYASYAVHTPICPIDSLLPHFSNKQNTSSQDNAKYATMIKNLDQNIGKLMAFLEARNLMENTLIIFTSDNGGVMGITDQKPLRAGKGSYYEGGIRVPLFFIWKGKIATGSRTDVPVTNLDFFPTILAALGITNYSERLDGSNILPILFQLKEASSFTERPLFWHFPIYIDGGNVDTQDLKFRTRPGSSIRKGDWKLIEYFENHEYELYNLKDDPSEKKNLASVQTSKLAELKALLEDWQKKTNAPVQFEKNPFYIQKL